LKNPFDTVIEGVGLNRPTANFNQAIIDDAVKVTDEEALHMAHYLIENEGIFVGGSSAMNVAAAVKYSRKNKG
jgi:cysteine synthase A